MACICPKKKIFGRIIIPFLRANRGKLHFASALTILWQRSSAILTRISLSLLCTAWRWRPLKHVFCKKKKKRKKKVTKVITWSNCVIEDQGLLQIIWFHAGFRSPIWAEIFVENPASRVFFLFSIAVRNSSFVSKSNDKQTNKAHFSLIWKETTLNVRLVDSHFAAQTYISPRTSSGLCRSSKRTVEPRLTTTPFIRPPRYYGHILSNQT